MHTLGERTKMLRKALKLRQNDLAAITGMSQGSISDIENNQKNYSFEAVISLIGYLRDKNISIDWLLTGEGEMEKNTTDIQSTQNHILKIEPSQLSIDEETLLDNYRETTTEGKKRMQKSVKNIWAEHRKPPGILSNSDQEVSNEIYPYQNKDIG